MGGPDLDAALAETSNRRSVYLKHTPDDTATMSLLPRPRSPGNLLPPRSPLDALDAKTIPAGKLPAQPVEGLVAVLGEVGGPSAPALAFSKDDQLLAVAWGRAVLLWRFGGAEPKPLTPLTGHQQDVLSLAFSPDSRILA